MQYREDISGYQGYAATFVQTTATPGIEYSVRSTNKVYIEYYDFDENEDPFYFDDWYFSWYGLNQPFLDFLGTSYPRKTPNVTVYYQVVLLGAVLAVQAGQSGGTVMYECASANQWATLQHCWYSCTRSDNGNLSIQAFHIDVIYAKCGYLIPQCPALLYTHRVINGGIVGLMVIDRCNP